MNTTISRPTFVRAAPFALFMLLLALRGNMPTDGSWGMDPRWMYGVTVLLVGGLLVAFARDYGELAMQNLPTWKEALWAVGVGLLVFVLWIHLDAPWMTLGEPSANFKPVDAQGALDWPLIAVRCIGAALLVPIMEELFWRSFLMRWIQLPTFLMLRPQDTGFKAIVLSTFVFMLAHTLWLAAILAGLAYAMLYVRSGKLWTSVIAHAVTNGALGAWVVGTGQWQYW